jgi:hypothetical protein
MAAIVAKTPFIAVDGSAARSAHLLSKAEHAVSPRVRQIWRNAYLRNEEVRANLAR